MAQVLDELGVDTIGIMKGSNKVDLAHRFINIALSPEVQSRIVASKKASLKAYAFLVVGEGIEKKQTDFAAEVQAQAEAAKAH